MAQPLSNRTNEMASTAQIQDNKINNNALKTSVWEFQILTMTYFIKIVIAKLV